MTSSDRHRRAFALLFEAIGILLAEDAATVPPTPAVRRPRERKAGKPRPEPAAVAVSKNGKRIGRPPKVTRIERGVSRQEAAGYARGYSRDEDSMEAS